MNVSFIALYVMPVLVGLMFVGIFWALEDLTK